MHTSRGPPLFFHGSSEHVLTTPCFQLSLTPRSLPCVENVKTLMFSIVYISGHYYSVVQISGVFVWFVWILQPL